MSMKFCLKCHQPLLATSAYFHKSNKTASGLSTVCKTCKPAKATVRKRIHHTREQVKALKRAKDKRRKLKYPEKHAAKQAVADAIKAGRMLPVKDKKCAYCGAQAEAHHHPSYAPEHRLRVIPLCRACHNKVHGLVPKR